MLKRVTSLLIGKDIDRSSGVTAGEDVVGFADGANALADGEIVVLDKNMKVLAAGATIADSDVIYIAQGTGTTFDVGSLSGVREVIVSDPIEGSKVKEYSGISYSAKSEQTSSLTLTGMTPVVGTEYIVRIIYKDINEHPGQFTHTYRHVAESATLDTFGAAIEAKINAHSGRRVTATYTTGTDVLLLTAREISECTSSLDNIDPFTMVEFDVFFNYVDSDGNWQVWPSTSTTVTTSAADTGSGEWEELRDLEKSLLSNRGVTNTISFPVIKPDYRTVKDATYDLIVIEHDKSYLSPDNAYTKDARLATVVAIPVPSSGTQTVSVLAQLNPWMASLPGAFENVSV
ncbi:MAG TPA: hypothetical protein VJ907_05840 [Halanaerobiales bacterium]|nr:hypothetical protein [Halanaerobiales bacterium]